MSEEKEVTQESTEIKEETLEKAPPSSSESYQVKLSDELAIYPLLIVKGYGNRLMLIKHVFEKKRAVMIEDPIDGSFKTVQMSDCNQLHDIVVKMDDKNHANIPHIFNSIQFIETGEKKIPDLCDKQLVLDKEVIEWMGIIAPGYSSEFKPYHMRKIWGWYKFVKAFLESRKPSKDNSNIEASHPPEENK